MPCGIIYAVSSEYTGFLSFEVTIKTDEITLLLF